MGEIEKKVLESTERHRVFFTVEEAKKFIGLTLLNIKSKI